MSKPCIFCDIVEGKQPVSIIYEDQAFMIIMDAYPLSKGHCLVLPKQHLVRLDQLSSKERTRLFELGFLVNESQKANQLGVNGTNILLNDGKAANQTVPHLHLHLIPRQTGDLLKTLPRLALHISGLFGLKTKRKQLDELANALRKTLAIDL